MNIDQVDDGLGFTVLSIKGKIFTIVSGGERAVVMKPGEDGEAATSLEVVLIKANSALSKVFYIKGLEEGSTVKPVCHSSDGKKPDADVKTPVNKTCADCPNNAWGSGNNGNSKACSDTRRVAIAPAGNLQDVMLLRVPPSSLKPLAEFADTCNKRGAPYPSVVCELKFECEESTPKLIFNPIAFLDAARLEEVKKLGESELVKQIIGLSGYVSPAANSSLTASHSWSPSGDCEVPKQNSAREITEPSSTERAFMEDLDSILRVAAGIDSIGDLMSLYINTRDNIEAEETAFKEKIKPKKEILEKIEQELKKLFDVTGTDNLTVHGVGTAYKKIVTSVTVADWNETWKYIQEKEAWDVLEHRANKMAVLARLKDEGELLPGINMSQIVDVQIRRA